MKNCLFKTDGGWTGLILRLAIGIVMFPHGAGKLLGWFGGHGFSATMNAMTGNGMPAAVVFLVIIGESIGSFALIVGFMTRFCAASIGIIMLGAVFMVHLQHGFFMNWFGAQTGEGFEYHILAIGICLALLVTGGGKFSIDEKICACDKSSDTPNDGQAT